MFSSSVQNRLEYYRNVLFLIILKRSLSYIIYLLEYKQQYVSVTNVSTDFRFSYQHLPSEYLLYSKTHPADSLHFSILTFHFHFTFPSTHISQLNSQTNFPIICSISFSTFQLRFLIPAFDVFFLSCHIKIL
jgi:hypothetical protein